MIEQQWPSIRFVGLSFAVISLSQLPCEIEETSRDTDPVEHKAARYRCSYGAACALVGREATMKSMSEMTHGITESVKKMFGRLTGRDGASSHSNKSSGQANRPTGKK